MRVHILALLANFIVAFKMQAYVRLDATFFFAEATIHNWNQPISKPEDLCETARAESRYPQ